MPQSIRIRPSVLSMVLGVIIGVVVVKAMDQWPRVHADGEAKGGKKQFSDQAETFREAAKKIGPSVVNIRIYAQAMVAERVEDPRGWDFGPFFRRRWKKDMVLRSVGSGFVLDGAGGFILTNNHVVEGGEVFQVNLLDKQELKATLVGSDPQTDIAVLKVEAQGLHNAQLGNSDEVQVGDWVLAAGNPFGMLEQTVTAGIISAKGRRGLGLTVYEDFLQTDAAINQGNSGGPLVNVSGEVIGVNSAIFSKSGGYQGISFAIPINQARQIAQDLIKEGQVTRGWMGLEMATLTDAQMKELGLQQGTPLLVEAVYRAGPAFKAIRPGDVILQFNGKDIEDSRAVGEQVAKMKPGTEVSLKILRFGEPKTVTLLLGRQPKGFGLHGNRGE